MQEYSIRWSLIRSPSTGELGTISGDGGALKWESEFYAMSSGTARGLTIKHALQEMVQMRNEEVKITLELETDSSAAKGMIHRHGVGR
eukprot:7705030-Pyramimonas_sp.AAC.1